jgi:hypothetical protein
MAFFFIKSDNHIIRVAGQYQERRGIFVSRKKCWQSIASVDGYLNGLGEWVILPESVAQWTGSIRSLWTGTAAKVGQHCPLYLSGQGLGLGFSCEGQGKMLAGVFRTRQSGTMPSEHSRVHLETKV